MTQDQNPVTIVQAVLANATNLEDLSELVTPDVTYIALNNENTELKSILPWTGEGRGPQHIVDTFTAVNKYWEFQAFEVKDIFGVDENVAAFGNVTIKSRTVGKTVSSPFAILAKVTDGKVRHMQFLEDTFGTAATFRTGGVWQFQTPDSPEVVVGSKAF